MEINETKRQEHIHRFLRLQCSAWSRWASCHIDNTVVSAVVCSFRNLTLWLTTDVMLLYLLLTTVWLIPVQPTHAWALVERIWALRLSCCLSHILTVWQTWAKIGFRSTGNSVRQNFPKKKKRTEFKKEKCWFEYFCSRIYLRWHNPRMPLKVWYITLQVQGRKAASDRKVRLCVAFLKFMWLNVHGVGRKRLQVCLL